MFFYLCSYVFVIKLFQFSLSFSFSQVFGSFWLFLAHSGIYRKKNKLVHFGSLKRMKKEWKCRKYWLIAAHFGSFWLILAHFWLNFFYKNQKKILLVFKFLIFLLIANMFFLCFFMFFYVFYEKKTWTLFIRKTKGDFIIFIFFRRKFQNYVK